MLQQRLMPRVPFNRYRTVRRPDCLLRGQSIQVDVKHLRLGNGRLYQFTAVDEGTYYPVLKEQESGGRPLNRRSLGSKLSPLSR